MTSDTLLAGMISSLLPPGHSTVTAILPPDQCPGHYDIKLSDIEKVKKADLVVFINDLPFIDGAQIDANKLLLVDTKGRNWMVPNSYIAGLKLLASELSRRFPEYRQRITMRRERAISQVTEHANALLEKIKSAGILPMPVIAASMQKEFLEWMGFHVVGEYGRPEAMSAKEIVRLSRLGANRKVIMIVDNLQSGPQAGKGVAQALRVPHVILSNFPSGKGYAATLSENVDAVLAALNTE